MIHLDWPWMVLALPLPWLCRRYFPASQPVQEAIFVPFFAQLQFSNHDTDNPAPKIYHLLFTVLWILLVLSAMRPQWLGQPQALPGAGRKLMLAVDVSGSMATQDMAHQTSRLEVVKQVAGSFIAHRHGDQIGLIVFGTHPYLQTPLTLDTQAANDFLQHAMIGEAGTQTAIGDAIGLALKRLNSSHSAGSALLILLTDGGNDAGLMPPIDAARIAAANHLRIYTIGVGAAVEPGFFGTSGNTDLDEPTLQAIAKITGGLYFRATDARALQSVYSRIDQLEPVKGHNLWYQPRQEYFAWPLTLALLLSLPLVLLGRRA